MYIALYGGCGACGVGFSECWGAGGCGSFDFLALKVAPNFSWPYWGGLKDHPSETLGLCTCPFDKNAESPSSRTIPNKFVMSLPVEDDVENDLMNLVSIRKDAAQRDPFCL